MPKCVNAGIAQSSNNPSQFSFETFLRRCSDDDDDDDDISDDNNDNDDDDDDVTVTHFF